MKKLLAAIITIFIQFSLDSMLFAQPATTYTSSAGGTGSWITSSDWVGNNRPPTNGIQNASIFIVTGDSIVRDGTLSFNNNDYLEINGILTITGSITINNNLDLIVNGKLYILGSLDVKNNAEFSISGSGFMDVSGDVDFGNNTIGDIDGTLNVGGDFSIGSGTITGDGTINAPNADICNDPAIDPTNLSCTDTNGTLPVEVAYFFAETEMERVKLSWATTSEENFDYFSVERASNGRDFHEIGRIFSKTDYSSIEKEYQFYDEIPLEGYSYYRLKATDFDGFTEYHGIVSVRLDEIVEKLSLFPNPSDGISVDISYAGSKDVRYKLLSFSGEMIETGQLDTGINNIRFQKPLSPGIYFVYLEGDVMARPKKLIVR